MTLLVDDRTALLYSEVMGKRLKSSSSGYKRRGKIPKVVLEESRNKLEKLQPRPYLREDPEELVHLDWSGERREAIDALLQLRRKQAPVSDQEIARAREADRP